MRKKSSSSENKPCCSKACKKNTDNLNSKITELTEKLNDKVNMIYHYSLGLLTASKDLDNLIESQRSDKNKEGLGYSVIPPPIAQIYSSPKKDLSWTGLLEFAYDTIIDYSRPSPTGASDSTILSKPAIKFVKAADKATERPTTYKVKIAKKPAVKDRIRRLSEDKKKQRNKKLEDSEAEHQV
nr:hypothetical protein [Tanacetum cinerariifolium]